MSKGIALLLDGGSSDLYASLCAIELAKRISSDIHAVAVHVEEPVAETYGGKEYVSIRGRSFIDPNESLKMAIRLSDYKGVKIYPYSIETSREEVLIEFLTQTRVSCLIVGADNQEVSNEKEKWLGKLRRRLCQGNQWYFGPFWTLVAKPWEDEVYKHMLEIMETYKQKFN